MHYSVGWTHYSVCCTHYSVDSKHYFTLLVVCTTLSVVNMYPVSCMHYFVSCKHLLCELYMYLVWYITLSVVCTTLLVGTLLCQLHALLFWLDPLLCCTHYMLALSHSSTLALFADNTKGFRTITSVSEHNSISEQYLPKLRSLYMVLVHSHLDYAYEIWSPRSISMIKLLGRGSNDEQQEFSCPS